MAQILTPADAPLAAVSELNAVPADAEYRAKAATRLPGPGGARPKSFIRILSAGGVERDLVSDSHTLLVEAFSDDEGESQRLCSFAVARLQAAARAGVMGGVVCYAVRVAALPANLPMPSVPDRVRHTATISVDLRRSAS